MPASTALTLKRWRSQQGAEIADLPGEFMMIDKHDLVVDRSYQRPASDARARAMAADWSWVACGTLAVVRRDAVWHVVDGQHRKMAADLTPDIVELPCMVYELAERREAAAAFLKLNTARSTPTMLHRLNAMVEAKNPHAVKIIELARSVGRDVNGNGAGPNCLSCVGVLLRLLDEDDSILTRVFPLAGEVCAGHGFHENVVRSLFYIERHADATVAEGVWRERIAALGYDRLQEAMRKSVVFHGSRHDKTLALGVVAALNHHRQQRNWLRLDTDDRPGPSDRVVALAARKLGLV